MYNGSSTDCVSASAMALVLLAAGGCSDEGLLVTDDLNSSGVDDLSSARKSSSDDVEGAFARDEARPGELDLLAQVAVGDVVKIGGVSLSGDGCPVQDTQVQ